MKYLTLISLMSHMTPLSHLKAIQYLTLKGNEVSHTDQFDVSHDPIEPLKGNEVSHTDQFDVSHNPIEPLKGNSVSHTDQFDVSHDPIEPLKGNSVSHTESLSAAKKRFLTHVPTTTTTTRC
jgi:hypothetical protein